MLTLILLLVTCYSFILLKIHTFYLIRCCFWRDILCWCINANTTKDMKMCVGQEKFLYFKSLKKNYCNNTGLSKTFRQSNHNGSGTFKCWWTPPPPFCHVSFITWWFCLCIKLLPGGLLLTRLSATFLTHYSEPPDWLKALMHGCQLEAALIVNV